MTPSQHRLLVNLQKKLRSKPFVLYKEVMSDLFRSYKDYDFVRTLSSLFETGQYAEALVFADSLAAQKYASATEHFVANQFALLIRKYPWDPAVVNTAPELKAMESFNRSERKCALMNRKFQLFATLRSPREDKLSRMRQFIRYIIGDSPPLPEIFEGCNFGSGASLGTHGDATSLSRKIGNSKWSVSPGAFVYSYWAVCADPYLRDQLLTNKTLVSGYSVSCLDDDFAKKSFRDRRTTITNYNKISFVPKTAKTHRAIAVEPLLNGFIQKGIDVFMRKRLKRAGINLEDQTVNQRLAREGSIPGSVDPFASIDLSSASDSISIGLVKDLLPPDWFDLLNSVRSQNYLSGKVLKRYAKFCSMGNGFCFPLESLLFAACCHACGCGSPGTSFSVYGDDIIVRASQASDVLELLKYIGFTANPDKTFLSGPFRESCGADWFEGQDVRPYTLDFALNNLESLFKFLNGTQRSQRTAAFFSGVRSIIIGRIPVDFQFFRPFKGEEDSGIDSVSDEYLNCRHCKLVPIDQYGWRGPNRVWQWKVLRHSPVYDGFVPSFLPHGVEMYALLLGAKPRKRQGASGVEFTFRRKTRTSVQLAKGRGSTSLWSPRLD